MTQHDMAGLTQDIPLVDLKRQHQTLKVEIEREVSRVMDSTHFFLGPNTRQFEERFAAYVGARECIGVASGTDALSLSLRACHVGPGDEVITVSHTFFATVEAITQVGATPVFVDVEDATYTMDVKAVEAAITPRTRAIIPVHLYGQLANMPAILAIAARHNLRVIEDACQAHGARGWDGTAGTFGDVGCFSFYYSKNLGAYGEAGGVVTNDPDIARTIRMLRDHGSEKRYHHDLLGVNGRLDEVQAAVLGVKLPHLDAWNTARRQRAARYWDQLHDLPLTLPIIDGVEHVVHLYVIRTPHRDELRTYLENHGVHTGIHYPVPCHEQRACAPFVAGGTTLPVTEAIAREILSLPMFPELTNDEVDYVAHTIREFFTYAAGRRSYAA